MDESETCALCGGELAEHDVTDEREETIRQRSSHDLDGKNVHAKVCTECGHVSYYSEEQ